MFFAELIAMLALQTSEVSFTLKDVFIFVGGAAIVGGWGAQVLYTAKQITMILNKVERMEDRYEDKIEQMNDRFINAIDSVGDKLAQTGNTLGEVLAEHNMRLALLERDKENERD